MDDETPEPGSRVFKLLYGAARIRVESRHLWALWSEGVETVLNLPIKMLSTSVLVTKQQN